MALEIVLDDDVALAAGLRTRLRREVARMVRAAALHDAKRDYDVALRLCNDAAIHELNRAWRGKDKPTDVLAFAQREAASADAALLGDLVISLDTAQRQAKRGLYKELLHLASHGLCHLLGYDHRDDAEEATMNTRAAALRREAGRSGRVRAA
ncbi:MAG TPA: rRNA maturation RNase YbeY [Kofleriaceae bacterium]